MDLDRETRKDGKMVDFDMDDIMTRLEVNQKKAAYILDNLIQDNRFDMIGEAVEEFCRMYNPITHDSIGTGLQVINDYLIKLEETIEELKKKVEV